MHNVCLANLSTEGSKQYYSHIVQRDRMIGTSTSCSLSKMFHTTSAFHRYFQTYKGLGVVEKVWVCGLIALLVDFYFNAATLAKSGTKGATFHSVRFNNLKLHIDTWYMVYIASTARHIPSSLPEKKQRQLKLQLVHRFTFPMFEPLLQASYNGFSVNVLTHIPRLSLFISDQPEQRTLMYLKRRDSDVEFTHCVIPSRLGSAQTQRSAHSLPSSSDEDNTARNTRRASVRNIQAQLYLIRFSDRDRSYIVRHKLQYSLHNIHRNMNSVHLAQSRRHIITHSFHNFPPALSCFAVLGSPPCKFYRIFSFDKVYFLDISVTQKFCDHSNTVLQRV